MTISPLTTIQEIKFGDNDTLSAITASMIHADYLFLLTDVEGLYTSNPRKDPNAKLIETVSSILDIRAHGKGVPAYSFPAHRPQSVPRPQVQASAQAEWRLN